MSNVHPSVTYKRRPNSWIGISTSIQEIFTQNCRVIPVFSHIDPKYITFDLWKCTDTHGVHKLQRTMLEILCRTLWRTHFPVYFQSRGRNVPTEQNYLWKKEHYWCVDVILLSPKTDLSINNSNTINYIIKIQFWRKFATRFGHSVIVRRSSHRIHSLLLHNKCRKMNLFLFSGGMLEDARTMDGRKILWFFRSRPCPSTI
jgi:hypothetical protein